MFSDNLKTDLVHLIIKYIKCNSGPTVYYAYGVNEKLKISHTHMKYYCALVSVRVCIVSLKSVRKQSHLRYRTLSVFAVYIFAYTHTNCWPYLRRRSVHRHQKSLHKWRLVAIGLCCCTATVIIIIVKGTFRYPWRGGRTVVNCIRSVRSRQYNNHINNTPEATNSGIFLHTIIMLYTHYIHLFPLLCTGRYCCAGHGSTMPSKHYISRAKRVVVLYLNFVNII